MSPQTLPLAKHSPPAKLATGGLPLSASRRAPAWAILAIGLLVALLAAGMVEGIVDGARGRIATQVALVRLEERLYQQAATERPALDISLGNTTGNTTRAVLLGSRRQETAVALAELDGQGVDEALLAQLRAELADYQGAVDDTLALLAAGQGDAAGRADTERALPRLATLHATIDAASAQADAAARSDDLLMEGSIVGTIILAVLAVSSLAWHWERVRALLERRLAHQAYHDILTGLPNRALFVARLDEALARPTHRRGALAVLFLDLDGFKHINDSLGHAAGDALLVIVAERLRACLRPEDTVGRLGGDEFTVLLTDAADVRGVVRVAERIAQTLAAPVALAGQEVVVTASVGIVLGAADHHRGDDLLRDADVAMYRAKHGGKGCHAVFEAGMHARALGRLELEADLRRAIAGDEFVVHYQPKVALATGRIAGVEALVRWQHPRRGLLFPADFITLTEETGLIVPLGRRVLEVACRQARAWQAAHPADPPLALCVNVSARQFRHPDLVADVAWALREIGLAPASLTLEITEGLLMSETDAGATLRALKGLGVRLAIDDFGTGYSSLAYLKRLPVDLLKIDRAFVSGLGHDPVDTGIVRTVLALAQTLGLEVVAEGVETAEQCAALRALGCDLGQGYYFAKPQDAATLGALLAVEPPRLPVVPLALVRRA